MGTRLRSWWQQIMQNWVAIVVVVIVLILVIALSITVIRLYGTGFKGKTLWDWLNLLGVLAVPIVGGILGYLFNRIQKSREEYLQRLQSEYAQMNNDNIRGEGMLQLYFTQILGFLLDKNLKESSSGDDVRIVARILTLSVFHNIDRSRKGRVLQFLHETSLILRDRCIINLDGADLRGALLRGIDLSETNLSGTDLSNADLRDADLSNADLRDADLSWANLKDAKEITTEELEKQAKSLTRATMPDGSIHP